MRAVMILVLATPLWRLPIEALAEHDDREVEVPLLGVTCRLGGVAEDVG